MSYKRSTKSKYPTMMMVHVKLLIFTLYITSAAIELDCAIASKSISTDSINTTISQVAKTASSTKKPAWTTITTTPKTNTRTTTTITYISDRALNNATVNKDHRPEASLLRPSFIRGFLGSRKRPGKQTEPDDEMEEVTQTIMVPMKQSELGQMNGKSKSLRASSEREISVPSSNRPNELSPTHPLAEASLRLTSTEMGGLLNDREAPEFYRERELNNDGILVGEEPAPRAGSSLSSSGNSRLGMAASGPFGSQFMGNYGPSGVGGSFDGGENAAAIYRQRLAQAASEDGYSGGSGFNHRFGQSFGGADELGMGGGSGQFSSGGLMQSPNEYSEVNSFNSGYGGGGAGFMGSQGHFSGSGGDYSPNSGLLRAGSEGSFGGSFNQGMMGGTGPLEMAAAGYGGGGGSEFSGASSGDFAANPFYGGGGNGGRLQAHASYNPYMATAGEADYANRFGYPNAGMGANSFGMDQRGFASQNNHQIMSQRLQQAASDGRSHGGRLMPLTPVIPLADELAGVTQPSVMSSNQRDQVSQAPGQLGRPHHLMGSHSSAGGGRGSQQIHEALEDDPTDVSQADDNPGGSEQSYESSFDGTTGSSSGGSDMGGMPTTTMSSNQRDQFAGHIKAAGYGPSFVLNVPPPSERSSSSPMPGFNHQHQRGLSQQQMVEFSRVGSAGYLGPPQMMHDSSASQHHGRSSLAKKFGRHYRGSSNDRDQDSSADDNSDDTNEDESSRSQVSSGVDNPAHAGKYIIDK